MGNDCEWLQMFMWYYIAETSSAIWGARSEQTNVGRRSGSKSTSEWRTYTGQVSIKLSCILPRTKVDCDNMHACQGNSVGHEPSTWQFTTKVIRK